VIIKEITRDEDKVDAMLERLGPELFDGLESRFSDATARTLLEPRDSQAQMQIGGM
jgi:hypothetical protein